MKDQIEQDKEELSNTQRASRAERALGLGEEGLAQLDREMQVIEIPQEQQEQEYAEESDSDEDEGMDAGAIDSDGDAYGEDDLIEEEWDEAEPEEEEEEEDDKVEKKAKGRPRVDASKFADYDNELDSALMNEEMEREERDKKERMAERRREEVREEVRMLETRRFVGNECGRRIFDLLSVDCGGAGGGGGGGGDEGDERMDLEEKEGSENIVAENEVAAKTKTIWGKQKLKKRKKGMVRRVLVVAEELLGE